MDSASNKCGSFCLKIPESICVITHHKTVEKEHNSSRTIARSRFKANPAIRSSVQRMQSISWSPAERQESFPRFFAAGVLDLPEARWGRIRFRRNNKERLCP